MKNAKINGGPGWTFNVRNKNVKKIPALSIVHRTKSEIDPWIPQMSAGDMNVLNCDRAGLTASPIILGHL